MVFENLTLFEIRMDGARFGPRSLSDVAASDDETSTAEVAGRRRVLPLFVLAFALAGIGMLWRRSRVMDAGFEFEAEDAEADLATPQ